MSKEEFVKKTERVTRASLIIAPTLMPLLFLPPLWGASDAPKYTFLILFSLLLLWLFALKILSNSKVKIYHNPLNFLVLSFLLTLVSSTFFSPDKEISFWGLPSRQTGLVTFLGFFIFWFFTANCIKDNKTRLTLFKGITFSASFVGIIAFLQRCGYTFGSWYLFYYPDPLRSFATFGNPNFLGAFLIISIPITSSLIFISKDATFKLISLFSLSIQVVSLYFTYSRGTWLGFLAALIFGFLLFLQYFKFKLKNFLSSFLILSLFTLLLIIGADLFRSQQISQTSYNFLSRLRSLPTEEGSTKERVVFWRVCLKIIKEHPLQGTGLERYQKAFEQYLPTLKESTSISPPDRPHNDFLQVATGSGLLALTFYFGIITAFFLSGINLLKKTSNPEETLMLTAILTGGLGYLVQNQFNFHTVGTGFFFWLTLGLVAGFSPEKEVFTLLQAKFSESLRISGLVFLALAFLILAFKLGLSPTLADWYFHQSINPLNPIPLDQKIHLNQKAIKLMPIYKRYFFNLSQLYLTKYEQTQSPEYFKKSVHLLEEIVKANPREELPNSLLAGVYLKYGEEKKNKWALLKAAQRYQILTQLNSKNSDYFYNLGVSHFLLEEYNEALFALKRDISLNPKDGKAYFILGKIYEKKNQTQKAIENYQKALELYEKSKQERKISPQDKILVEKIQKRLKQLEVRK